MNVEEENDDKLSEESRMMIQENWELIPLETRRTLFDIADWTEGDWE